MTRERRQRRSIAGGWLSATLTAVAVAVLLPLATFLTAVWLLGLQLQSVQSGSMEPTFPVGSLLVVGQVDPATVRAGSVVVFRDSVDRSRLVTHRVVEVVPGAPPAFVTKGDANRDPDARPVAAEQVMGRPLWSVTHLGGIVEWLSWPRSLLLVVIPGVLLAADGWRGRGPRPVRPSGHQVVEAAADVQ